MDAPKPSIIKNIYLYLVSFVALMMVVFSTADIINIVLRTYIFPKADQAYNYIAPCVPVAAPDGKLATSSAEDCAKQQALQDKQNIDSAQQQKQRDIVRDISFILVGIPLFLYHWNIVRKKD